MLHLPTERLAALCDEPPTQDELAHLAGCAPCARERRAYESLVSLAQAEQESFALPLTRWDTISAALASDSRAVAPVVVSPRRTAFHWRQVAASLLLVGGGAMLGRVSAGVQMLPDSARVAQGSVLRAPSGNPDSVFFNSVEDARAKQLRAEAEYQQASAYLARNDSSISGEANSPVTFRSRLAALDQVISTTREAMREAPHDPVINNYYLTTLSQRETTLRQLNTALPASYQVNSF